MSFYRIRYRIFPTEVIRGDTLIIMTVREYPSITYPQRFPGRAKHCNRQDTHKSSKERLLRFFSLVNASFVNARFIDMTNVFANDTHLLKNIRLNGNAFIFVVGRFQAQAIPVKIDSLQTCLPIV